MNLMADLLILPSKLGQKISVRKFRLRNLDYLIFGGHLYLCVLRSRICGFFDCQVVSDFLQPRGCHFLPY